MELDNYTNGHIESFLLNYRLFVHDLAELAASWPELDPEEQSDARTMFIQIWGNRKVLGALYRAQCLSPSQSRLLADFDRALLSQTPLMQHCFGFDFAQLLAIFRWGTPLLESTETVQVEITPITLQRMAVSLTPAFAV